jgi:hypothetical protein
VPSPPLPSSSLSSPTSSPCSSRPLLPPSAFAGEGTVLSRPVKDAAEGLVKRIGEWREEGSTALGPAVLVAVAMAAARAGSRVVICTDGLANQGLGSLEAPDMPRGTDANQRDAAFARVKEEASAFFDRVKALAVEAGVSIDVIGFEGADCNLEALASLAEATSGSVTRVSPANITEQFAGVVEEELVAHNASVTMVRVCVGVGGSTHAGLCVWVSSGDQARRASCSR